MNKRIFLASLLLFSSVSFPVGVMAAGEPKIQPLMIEEQGSFAVGGTVISTPGTFNPQKPAEPAGQQQGRQTEGMG